MSQENDRGSRPRQRDSKSLSPRGARLVGKLRLYCAKGQAWPAKLAHSIDSLSAAELGAVFKSLDLRWRLYKQEDPIPAWYAMALVAPQEEVPVWCRAQMLHFVSRLP